ncbi:MAG: ATP-dependent DNA helicase RecG [Deltaproteobacteria bacterium]|nr:ATP-dependent DNA helicase RecG [Deltaproteobacteria bacterium]
MKDALSRPLAFASKDSFAHIGSIKGLDALVSSLCDSEAHHVPNAHLSAITTLKRLFLDFDSLPTDYKKERICEAMRLLDADASPMHPASAAKPPLTEQEADERLKAFATPLRFIKGIGPRLAERFAAKGLLTVEDALYCLPLRYEDRSRLKKVRELVNGEDVAVLATVIASSEARYGRRKVFEMAADDSTGILKIKWFHYKLSYMKDRYKSGSRLLLYGRVSKFGHQFEMIHPDIEVMDETETSASLSGVMPVYSQLDGLHQKTLRKIFGSIAADYGHKAVDSVPVAIRSRRRVLEQSSAFEALHLPQSSGLFLEKAREARRTLAFDELFMLELGLAMRRRAIKKEGGISFKAAGTASSGLEARLRESLPFSLTVAQEKALSEIRKDMRAALPMNRLLQGDVGSGKTVVSLISALWAIESGYQSAIMSPTEILAEQHYLTIHRYMENIGIRAALLRGAMKAGERRAALKEIREGTVDLVVGTHALIQKDVEFANLGLVVIDEQHRFGVVQRGELRKKAQGVSPDILLMTATPIPRTLAMTVFGDLDVSIIDQLPPGRQPIGTRILKERGRGAAYQAIRKELATGGQCYIVYPLVEESKELSLKDATSMKEHLQRDIFPEYRIGLLHGRLSTAEKESVMKGFKDGLTHILVSTTVIEVGVDVPNATIMLIEHAERFGLAQLHQLRGRVGRGAKPSLCMLLAAWTNSEDTYKRLKVMTETCDGFVLAEEDLKIRGPGNFTGVRQSGLPDLRLSFALTDATLLKAARDDAFAYLESNPELAGPEGVLIRKVLRSRWEARLELAQVG